MINQTPVYNLSAVLRETGLKADVLRVWEKRYDLPKPQRSQGGHRLYSQYDIETIKWLRARQGEGLSISRAVELWREITSAGHDPLAEYSGIVPHSQGPSKLDTNIDFLREKWLESCLAFDNGQAEQILNQAFAIYPVETVCTDILQQGLNSIGALWYTGNATIQQEHFISALAIRRVEALILAAPLPWREHTVLLGCPSGEQHTFPVLLLDLFLRRRGWRVVYLGADVPADQLVETARAVQPGVIVLSAQRLVTAAALRQAVQNLLPLHIPQAYGGLIFSRVPEIRKRIPAWFAGETIEQAELQIEQLASFPTIFPDEILDDEIVQETARQFSEKRPLIEIALNTYLPEETVDFANLKEVTAHFGDSLSAALALGDPTFIEVDLDWANWLLSGRQINPEYLASYLNAYLLAVQKVMGDQANLISHWLMSYLANH